MQASKDLRTERKDLEDTLDLLFLEIGKYQTVLEAKAKGNVFRMKQAYQAYQNDYFDLTGHFYEPPQ